MTQLLKLGCKSKSTLSTPKTKNFKSGKNNQNHAIGLRCWFVETIKGGSKRGGWSGNGNFLLLYRSIDCWLWFYYFQGISKGSVGNGDIFQMVHCRKWVWKCMELFGAIFDWKKTYCYNLSTLLPAVVIAAGQPLDPRAPVDVCEPSGYHIRTETRSGITTKILYFSIATADQEM